LDDGGLDYVDALLLNVQLDEPPVTPVRVFDGVELLLI
jgi:hypothetical protein